MRRSHICRCLPVLVAVLVACDGVGDGCGGGCQEGIAVDGLVIGTDLDFPRTQALANSAGLTITQEGFDIVSELGPILLANALEAPVGELDLTAFLNDFLTENPVQIFGWSLRGIDARATLPDGDQSLTITVLEAPTRLRIEISRLWIAFSGTVFDDEGAVTAACYVAPEADVGDESPPQTVVFEDITIDIVLGTTPDGQLDLSTEVVNLGLVDIGVDIVDSDSDPNYYCNLPECMDGCTECILFCNGGDLLIDLGLFFTDLFESVFDDVAELIANILLDGIQAIEGRLHPALLLGDLVPPMHDAGWFSFRVAPGAQGFAALPSVGGDDVHDLFMSFSGGSVGDLHPCVDKSEEEPAWSPPNAYRLEAGETQPHVSLALNDTVIDQALWSAYNAGALCLAVDSSAIGGLTGDFELNAGLLSLLLPGLDELVPADAPVLITIRPRLRPSDFPLVLLGAPEQGESLLSFDLAGLELGIYVYYQDRFLQLVGVTTALGLDITPTLLPDNQIELAIDSLEASVLEETYNELFVDVELSELVNFVLELATELIAEEGGIDLTLPLDDLLSGLFGLPLSLVIDRLTVTGPERRWLELAVRLEESEIPAVHQSVDTELHVLDVRPGEAIISVRAPGWASQALEYQVRYGFGAWSGFRPAGVSVVRSGWLRVPGERTIEVRARVIGDYRSLDMTPASRVVATVATAVEAPGASSTPASGAGERVTGCAQVGVGARAPAVALFVVLVLGSRRRATRDR